MKTATVTEGGWEREGRRSGRITPGTAAAEPPSLRHGHPPACAPGDAAGERRPALQSPHILRSLPHAPRGGSRGKSGYVLQIARQIHDYSPPRITGNYTWTERNNYRRSTVDATARLDVCSAKPALPPRVSRHVGAAERTIRLHPKYFCPAAAGEMMGCDTFSLRKGGLVHLPMLPADRSLWNGRLGAAPRGGGGRSPGSQAGRSLHHCPPTSGQRGSASPSVTPGSTGSGPPIRRPDPTRALLLGSRVSGGGGRGSHPRVLVSSLVKWVRSRRRPRGA